MTERTKKFKSEEIITVNYATYVDSSEEAKRPEQFQALGLEPWPLQSVLQSGQNEIDIFDT